MKTPKIIAEVEIRTATKQEEQYRKQWSSAVEELAAAREKAERFQALHISAQKRLVEALHKTVQKDKPQ